MKVVSFNCFDSPLSFNTKIRFRLIPQELEKLNADIILLQEVVFSKNWSTVKKGLEKSGYTVFPLKHMFRSGGLMAAIKNFQVKQIEFYGFKDQGPLSFLSLTDRAIKKGFQVIKIANGDKNITVLNTHLLCVYKGTAAERKSFNNQLDELIGYLNVFDKNNLILAGDINALPHSMEIKKLKRSLEIHDYMKQHTSTVVPNNLNRSRLVNWYSGGRSYRTDYIFWGKNFNVKSQKVIFENNITNNGKVYNLSDHYGLIGEASIS